MGLDRTGHLRRLVRPPTPPPTTPRDPEPARPEGRCATGTPARRARAPTPRRRRGSRRPAHRPGRSLAADPPVRARRRRPGRAPARARPQRARRRRGRAPGPGRARTAGGWATATTATLAAVAARGSRRVGRVQPPVDRRPALGGRVPRPGRGPVHRPRPPRRGARPRLPRLATAASPARPDKLATSDDLVRRSEEHSRLIADLVDIGHRLGFSCWIGARQQPRKVGGRPLRDRLDDRELAGPPSLGRIAGARPRGRRRPVVRPRPDGVRCSRSSGPRCCRTPSSGATRGCPPDERLVRFLVILPERAELVRHKLDRSPLLRDGLEAGGWHLLKANHGPRLGRRARRSRWPTSSRSWASTPRPSGPATSSRCSAAEAARPGYPRPDDPRPPNPPAWGSHRDRRHRHVPHRRHRRPVLGVVPASSPPRRRRSTATTATTTGWTTRARRPGGRPRAREPGPGRDRGGARGRPRRRGADHPRHAGDRREPGDRRRRPRGPRDPDADHIDGAADDPRAAGGVPGRPTRPSGSTAGWPGSARTSAYMDATIQILRDGMASGRTSARIVAERTIRQLEGVLGDRRSRTRRSSGCRGSPTTPTGAQVAAVVRDVVRPADQRFLDFLRDEYLATTREEPGLVSAPGGEALYRYAIRAWTTLDLDPREVHQVGLDELAGIDASGARSRATRGSATTSRRTAGRWPTDPANQAATKEELVARATEDIARAGGRRAAGLRAAAAGRLRGPPGRAVQGEGRAVRVLLPADARRLAPRHLLRQHLRPAEPDVLEAGVDDVPRGDPGPPLPDRAGGGAPDAQRVPAAGRAAHRRGATSRAGACTRSGSPTSWACTATGPSGWGCSMRRRGGPRG